jgi:hypothetical protein
LISASSKFGPQPVIHCGAFITKANFFSLVVLISTRTKENLRESVMRRYHCRWEYYIKELLSFREEFGHCAVPRRWKVDAQLASWVMRQVSDAFAFLDSGMVDTISLTGVSAAVLLSDPSTGSLLMVRIPI